MITTKTEPIQADWTIAELAQVETGLPHASAIEVNQSLARLQVAEIDDRVVPFLAAAAAEMALSAGIPWRFSADDPPVALLRLIAKIAIKDPQAGGPHTDRLLAQLIMC